MTEVTKDVRTDTIEVNGTTLYHEVRGDGPAILCVSGATGDAGHWERVVDALAADHTVVSYDRRANSRSPRPTGWTATSADEQADDAAALIEALDLAPAVVVANSGGAIIGLNLIVRHPELVRTALLHEPPLFAGLADPGAVMGVIEPIVEEGMASGGPTGAALAFLGFAAGDATRHLAPATLERMVNNGEVLFGVEFGALEPYRPADAELANNRVPVHVLIGTESAPFFGEAGGWLAERLGTDVVAAPGAHVPMMSDPDQFVELVRTLI